MCFLFSLVPSYFPLMRETDRKKVEHFWKLTLILYNKKTHLAMANLKKLVFWWILSFKNWLDYAKLLNFFVCQFFLWDSNMREWDKIRNTYSELIVLLIPYFCLLVFGIFVTLVAWFSFHFSVLSILPWKM